MINIRCDVCGEPMDFKKTTVYPGTSETVYEVSPCCMSGEEELELETAICEKEELQSDIDRIRDITLRHSE